MLDKQSSIEQGGQPNKRKLGILKSRFNILKVLALAGTLSSTACQTSVQSAPQVAIQQIDKLPETKPPERVEKVELEGNLKVGKVTHIRQLHRRPEFTDDLLLAVGEYQFKILQELEASQVKHVFVESLYEEIPPDDPNRKEGIYGHVALAFPDGVPDQPNEPQKMFLAEFGADMIYAYLNDDVFLHKTLTKEESNKIDAAIRENRPNAATLMIDEREKLASREVASFLAENPGARVTLVYGGMHNFADDFSSDDSPQLVSVKFPRQSAQFKKKTADSFSFSFPSFTSAPKLSLADIQKAEKIYDSEFQHIVGEEAQLAALKKLELDHAFFKKFNAKDGETLKSYLLDHAASDKVKMAINMLISQ